MLILNFIVLIFEILFYSMFMYYSKREGKFSKYFLLFTLITIIGTIIGTDYLFSCVILVFLMLNGLKYIVKLKPQLYNLFILVTMLIFKIIIEGIIVLIFYNIFGMYITIFLFEIIKILTLIIFRNKLSLFYKYMYKLWYKNNFYIRYIFSCLIVVYVIFSALALINY